MDSEMQMPEKAKAACTMPKVGGEKMSHATWASYGGLLNKLKPSTEFYCELCEICLNSGDDLKMHLSWRTHLRLTKVFNRRNNLPLELQIPKKQLTAQCSLEKALRDVPDSEPLVGLGCIYEYMAKKRTTVIKYSCLMCNCKANTKSMVHHVLGNKHRLRYLELYSKTHYDKVQKNKPPLRQQLQALCQEIEGKLGRGFPLFGPVGQETRNQSFVPFDNQADAEPNNAALSPHQMARKEILRSVQMSDFVEKPQSVTVPNTVKERSHIAVDSLAIIGPNAQRPWNVQSQAKLINKPSGMESGTEQIHGFGGNFVSVARKVLNKEVSRLTDSNTADLDFTSESEIGMLTFDKNELQKNFGLEGQEKSAQKDLSVHTGKSFVSRDNGAQSSRSFQPSSKWQHNNKSTTGKLQPKICQQHHRGLADKTVKSATESQRYSSQKDMQLSNKTPCSKAVLVNLVIGDSKTVAVSKPAENIESKFVSEGLAQTLDTLKVELMEKYLQRGMDLTSANQKLVERLELLSSYSQLQVPFDLAVQRVRDGDERDVLLLEYELLTLSLEDIESRIDRRVVVMKQRLACGTDFMEAAYQALDSEVKKDFTQEFEALGLKSNQAQKLAERRIRMLEYLALKGWTVKEAAQKVLALETQQRKIISLAQKQSCPVSQAAGKKEAMDYVMMTLRILGFTHKEQVEQLEEAVCVIKRCQADKDQQKDTLINMLVTFPTFPSSCEMASKMAGSVSSKQVSDNASTDVIVVRDSLDSDGSASAYDGSSSEYPNSDDDLTVAEEQMMSSVDSQESEEFTRILDHRCVQTQNHWMGYAKVPKQQQAPEGRSNEMNGNTEASKWSPCSKRSRSREGSRGCEGRGRSEVNTRDRSPYRKRRKSRS